MLLHAILGLWLFGRLSTICPFLFQTDMIMANNLLHMSDEHFTNSERFLPERWLRNDGQFGAEFKSRHPFVYLPLGFGARMCIGKRFAEMELQILTAR